MKKRFRIHSVDPIREVPRKDSEVRFQVTPASSPVSSLQELVVFITAVDPSWGPNIARIEGYIRDSDGTRHAVLGQQYIEALPKHTAGYLEVFLDEA